MLLYDHFIANGGAEKVSVEMAQALDCHIHTIWASHELFPVFIDSGLLRTAGVDYQCSIFPTWRLIRYYQKQLSIPDNEAFVIASGAFSPLCLSRYKNGNMKKIVYFHTFPSFTRESFFNLKKKYGFIASLIFKLTSLWYVKSLKSALKQADIVYSNSLYVQKKFRSYLNVESEVLYPPVPLDDLYPGTKKGFFLSTARLEANKQVNLVLEVFANSPELNLIVAGGGTLLNVYREQYQHCSNIHFLGWQQPEQLKYYYRHCRGLLHLAKQEYFGIAPVEAMACGKAVIGIACGGLLETVSDPRCGILLNNNFTLNELYQAIKTVDQADDDSAVVAFRVEHAQQFAEKYFYQKLKYVLDVDVK